MAEHQDDPVLKKQAENRALHDRALAKHGWKLGKVGVRQGGQVIVYELIRTDGHTAEVTRLLSDILMQSLNDVPGVEPSLSTVMLGLTLLIRVKQENQANPCRT